MAYQSDYHIKFPERVDGRREKRDLSTSEKVLAEKQNLNLYIYLYIYIYIYIYIDFFLNAFLTRNGTIFDLKRSSRN